MLIACHAWFTLVFSKQSMDDVIADADVLEELVLLRLGQLRRPPRVLEDDHERLPPLHDVLVPQSCQSVNHCTSEDREATVPTAH
jgi:hypothetical protein